MTPIYAPPPSLWKLRIISVFIGMIAVTLLVREGAREAYVPKFNVHYAEHLKQHRLQDDENFYAGYTFFYFGPSIMATAFFGPVVFAKAMEEHRRRRKQ